MLPKFTSLLTLFSTFAVLSFAQGLQTNASPDDWEEINFEYNSAVLSDGYPSLLRLADLLKNNPGYRVRLEGHADYLGSDNYNEKLGLARAQTVHDFLVKYGARADQVTIMSRGEHDPKVPPGRERGYRRTDVARWMNRRVTMTVTDQNGRTVSAGGIKEAISAIPPATQQCCDEILKRLDRLDEIAKMLHDMADQNAALRKQVDDLKAQQAALESRINGLPKPLNEEQTRAVVQERIEKNREPRFALLGLNVGSDSWKHVTFTGRARYFAPFKEHFALQAQGEYMYFHEAREGQFDIGLVDRIGRFQGGLFSSFKHVTLRGNQNSGTLGQAALTLDYLFGRGKVGVFGTHGFLDSSVINRQNAVINNGVMGETCAGAAPGTCAVLPNVFLERYLRVVDQAGISGTVGLAGNTYLEGNIGYLRSRAHADRPGGTLRFVFPFSDRFAFTVEGGMNETFLQRDNWGRAVVGIQFGNFTRPKEYASVDHPVPADVPRVRYEVLTRTVRNGAAPPVADAGPDQIGIAPGTVMLNGSGSYDPNGEKLTYTWTQESGPGVALSGANSATASFEAAAGEVYVFRLTVRNESGLTASARTRVTTRAQERVQILLFAANPQQIQSGQASQLSWRVLNATDVTISGIGAVAASGTSSVSPTETTTYKLTARNESGEENATATVVVQAAQTRVFGCYATPTNINAGEAATINFQTENATNVSVSPDVGAVGTSGSFVVTPTTTTTYTITANGPNNATANCAVIVTVNQNTGLPRVIRFTAAPASIVAGQTSALVWQVENADSVMISGGVGNVPITGTQDVQPQQTTTYTLTATNSNGNTTATATVTVAPAGGVTITTFTANPPVSPAPGSPVTLTCLATGAASVSVAGAGALSSQGTVVVNPTTDTTYTCTAIGGNGEQAVKTLTVTVTPGGPPPPSGPPPTVVIAGGPVLETVVRTVRLDASQSNSPAGFTPLTYHWTSRDGRAAIDNATSPSPTVYLGNMFGPYFFDVTVKDAKGNTATGSVEVRLVVTRVP